MCRGWSHSTIKLWDEMIPESLSDALRASERFLVPFIFVVLFTQSALNRHPGKKVSERQSIRSASIISFSRNTHRTLRALG